MGQATVDLPDPLDNPNSAPTASADDLLAQLAGDEIDRLLAESDVEKVSTAPGETDEPVTAVPAVEIGDVFAELDSVKGKPAATTQAVDRAAEATPAFFSAEVEQLDPSDEHAERAALGATDDAVSNRTADIDLGGGELPIIFKPLVWLNAPLDACPQGLREALGKIAILTMVNAIAVLAYVLIFRRHH